MDFREWLLNEERHLIPVPVANSWEGGFQDELVRLIARTKHPALRSEFQKMRSCPVRDNRGTCRGFVDYITGAMLRNRCGLRDPEDSLARICHQLLTPVNLQGQPRATLFGHFDESKPFIPGTNPLEARFKVSVGNAVRNLCDSDRRGERHGTVSIVAGRGITPAGTISADEIPARGGNEGELFADLERLLRDRQQQNLNLPLVSVFRSMIDGDSSREQVAKFGSTKVKQAREIIIQAINDYARSSENWELLRLLGKPAKTTTAMTKVKPKLTPDQQDFASIVAVMERNGGMVTLARLQKDRRRWMERKPRDPNSTQENRLEDVLAKMVAAGVLVERQTRKGGRYFVAGSEYGKYGGTAIQS